MPEFNTLTEAFEWFLENIYPDLPPEKKTSALRSTKSVYYRGGKISEKRMRRVLEEHCNYKNIHRLEVE